MCFAPTELNNYLADGSINISLLWSERERRECGCGFSTLLAASLPIVIVNVELVQNTMDQRRKYDSHYRNEHESAEERVKGREYLSAVIGELLDRTHAAENHRRFQQRVNPFVPGDEMITEDADGECQCREADTDANGAK